MIQATHDAILDEPYVDNDQEDINVPRSMMIFFKPFCSVSLHI